MASSSSPAKKMEMPSPYLFTLEGRRERYTLFDHCFLPQIPWTKTGRPFLSPYKYPVQQTASYLDDEYMTKCISSWIPNIEMYTETGEPLLAKDRRGVPISDAHVHLSIDRRHDGFAPQCKVSAYAYTSQKDVSVDDGRLPSFPGGQVSSDLVGRNRVLATDEGLAWILRGPPMPCTIPLQTSICLAPQALLAAGIERVHACTRVAMSLDGRYAMVSTAARGMGRNADKCGGWAIEVFDSETGCLVANAKEGCVYPTEIIDGLQCIRFEDLLMTALSDRVVLFDQTASPGPEMFCTGLNSDFVVPETAALFEEGAKVVTRLEPMVDRSKARAVQSDGKTVVYSVVRAPSSGSPFHLRLVEVHKTVDMLKEDVRCAISPDGLHLLTLSSLSATQIRASVDHHTWKQVRPVLMAFHQAKKAEEPPLLGQVPEFLVREIVDFMRPGGIHRRYRLLRDPYCGDSTDILPEL
jgi:hypothetical protein